MSFRSAAELFRIINTERTDRKYSVTVTLFEIYNEAIRDLLIDPNKAKDKKYEIKMADKGHYIPDLKMRDVTSQHDVVKVPP